MAIHSLSEPVRTRHWSFFGECHNIRGQYRENRTKGLYQWLTQRASFFRSDKSADNTSRTVRTEVTVERRQGLALLTGDAAAGFDACPFCGGKLAPDLAERARLRIPKASISQESPSLDHAPP